MLTEIIKRNGKKVPFDLEKLHNWIIWAGETISDRVNWSEIVLETLGQLKDGATTTELQNKLIKSCVNKGDYPHNLMAGRLFAAVYRKEVFGKIEPLTIKQQHEKLLGLGLMVKLEYSDEEYAELEKIIDHSRDFDMAYFQLKQAYNKYSLRDATTKTVYETPQFIFMRMAMALAEDEPTKTRLRDAKNWYKYFSELKISAPTPNYTNLGTRQRGYASCCVIKSDDNLGSIGAADHATMRMSANAAGIGTHYGIRSTNDPVRDGLIKHGGKLPYFRSTAFQAKANMQNSARGGAISQYFSVYDPEILTLIRMQNPTTVKTMQIRESHFAVIMNTFLLKKAAKKEQVFHFNAFTAPDLYDAMFSGDQEEFSALYEKYENNKKFEKVYFNPRELLIEIKKEALAAGTLYLWNADIANTQTPFKDKIYSSNLCFTGDTLVAVADGRNAVSIATLAAESNGAVKFPVYSARKSKRNDGKWFTEIKDAVAFQTGVSQVLEVKLSDGSSFRCTPDHELATTEAGVYVKAKDSVGVNLEPFFTSLGNTRKYRHINSKSDGHAKQHYMIWVDKNGIPPRGYHIDHINNIADDRLENLQLLPEKEHHIKTGVEFSNENNAVFHIRDPETYKHNTIVRSTLYKNPRWLGLTNTDLFNIAKRVYDSGNKISLGNMKEIDNRVPTSLSKNRFGGNIKNLIDLVVSDKEYIEPEKLVKKKPIKEAEYFVKELKVVSVDVIGEEPVYDLNVHENHNFYIITSTRDSEYIECSGVLVHNCLEIDLPTGGYNSVVDLYSGKEFVGTITLENENGERITLSNDEYVTTQRGKIKAGMLQEGDEIL